MTSPRALTAVERIAAAKWLAECFFTELQTDLGFEREFAALVLVGLARACVDRRETGGVGAH